MLTGNPWCAKCQGYVHPANYDCDAARERHFAKMNDDACKSMAANAAPSDDEATAMIERLRGAVGNPPEIARQFMNEAADLIRRLAAAKAERDALRADLEGGAFVPISEWNITIAERDELQAKLREARGLAIEECAALIESRIAEGETPASLSEPDEDGIRHTTLATKTRRWLDPRKIATSIRALSNPE